MQTCFKIHDCIYANVHHIFSLKKHLHYVDGNKWDVKTLSSLLKFLAWRKWGRGGSGCGRGGDRGWGLLQFELVHSSSKWKSFLCIEFPIWPFPDTVILFPTKIPCDSLLSWGFIVICVDFYLSLQHFIYSSVLLFHVSFNTHLDIVFMFFLVIIIFFLQCKHLLVTIGWHGQGGCWCYTFLCVCLYANKCCYVPK